MADEIFAGLQFDNIDKLVKAYNKVLMYELNGRYAFDNCEFLMDQGDFDLTATASIGLHVNSNHLELGTQEISAAADRIYFEAKDADDVGTEINMTSNSMTLSGASTLTLTAEDIYIKGTQLTDGYSRVHITDVAYPIMPLDAANKDYVDTHTTLFITYGDTNYDADRIQELLDNSQNVIAVYRSASYTTYFQPVLCYPNGVVFRGYSYNEQDDSRLENAMLL